MANEKKKLADDILDDVTGGTMIRIQKRDDDEKAIVGAIASAPDASGSLFRGAFGSPYAVGRTDTEESDN